MAAFLPFVLFVLAVYSVTHLVADDEFPPIVAFRSRVGPRLPAPAQYLLGCYWCQSIYWGYGLLGLLAWADRLPGPWPWLWPVAARPLAGWLAMVEQSALYDGEGDE